MASTSTDEGYFIVTCYDLTGTTASGDRAGWGSIAADPAVFRFGTHLSMPGYSGTVDDTGGAIKGRHLDVWMTPAACDQWGRRYLDVERT